MKLITEELEKRFKEVGSQKHETDPLVIARFQMTDIGLDVFAIEYDPSINSCYGYLIDRTIGKEAWGSYSIDALEEAMYKHKHLDLWVERDMSFKEQRVSTAVPELSPRIREKFLEKERKSKQVKSKTKNIER